MIDLAVLLLMNSALCFGFWNACNYQPRIHAYDGGDEVKGVLWFIEKWSKGKWFHKPLCGCLPCVASLHSVYPYWIYMYNSGNMDISALLFYPVYILALSGVNYLIDRG